VNPSCFAITVQGGGGVMLWGMFSWPVLCKLLPNCNTLLLLLFKSNSLPYNITISEL